tara:strand:+ start:256 stop:582 length:327 start_codon:yes stop_codon:yes gene_type:complete
MEWLFLACLAARIGLVVLAKILPPEHLPWMGAAALIPVMGWIALIFGVWKRKTGALGQQIWWSHMRPVHATLFATFAIMAFRKMPTAYIPLAVDVTVGAIAFGVHNVR